MSLIRDSIKELLKPSRQSQNNDGNQMMSGQQRYDSTMPDNQGQVYSQRQQNNQMQFQPDEFDLDNNQKSYNSDQNSTSSEELIELVRSGNASPPAYYESSTTSARQNRPINIRNMNNNSMQQQQQQQQQGVYTQQTMYQTAPPQQQQMMPIQMQMSNSAGVVGYVIPLQNGNQMLMQDDVHRSRGGRRSRRHGGIISSRRQSGGFISSRRQGGGLIRSAIGAMSQK